MIPDYGNGWMTNSARDLVKIMVTFGGLDLREFNALLLAHVGKSSRMVNAGTVETILASRRKGV